MPLNKRHNSILMRRTSVMRHGSQTSLSNELNMLKEQPHTGDHYLTPAQLEVMYRTNVETGLTEELAEELYEQHGPNQLKELKGTSYCKIFMHNMFGWFQCILWIGASLNFVAYFIEYSLPGDDPSIEHIYLGMVIALTVLGTGLFGFYQEAKNAHVMSGFEKMVPPDATVVRDGIRKVIPSTEVVIGDIVEMSGGEVVPADVRILSCTNFQTDMSAITGETIPIKHTVYNTHDNPIESKNMAFFSCSITQGSARGIVVSTGELTQIGRIAGLVTGLEKEETPISKEITHFIKILCGVSFAFGIIFFIMVFLVHNSFLKGFQYMLGIILANVPEGLIVTLTICMTLSANILKTKNCLAKTLQAVETLGSTSCICSDKTGTLTENRMSVSHLFCNWTVIDKEDWSYVTQKAYGQLCIAASLCLKAVFSYDTIELPVNKRKIIGDASESAILRYMETHRNASIIRQENSKVCEIPFSSEYKYQVSIHSTPNERYYLVMKGAPDIVIDFCASVLTDGDDAPMSPTDRQALKTQFTSFGKVGERVLGYCDMPLPPDEYPLGYPFDSEKKNFPLTNLRFVGLISLIDPPREGIEESIGLCKQAGIKVVMVTGDHPVTALAISRKCGTISKDSMTAFDYAFEHNIDAHDVPQYIKETFPACVVTGEELRFMSGESLKTIIRTYPEITFARTSPQQKLFIVETFQSLGYVVAVTGDGVNDSPALKKADIGIAMGITGSEVSKQAADMILLDDNFSSIVLGVEEGRRIFDNLKKTIAYTLTSNTPEMMPFVLYAICGIPLPLTIILILVINVGTDILPAMSLAYEDSELDIMNIPPRKLTDHLVTRALIFMAYFQVGLIQFFGGMYAYFVIMAVDGFYPAKLLGIRNNWDSHSVEYVANSFGKNWNYNDRKALEKKAQTAYFFAICLTQVTDVIICKTRRVSLIKKGMKNHVMNCSIFVALLVALMVIYIPVCNTVMGTVPLDWWGFLLGLPFGVFMIVGDEIRRYLIRNNKSKWLESETYY